MPRATPSAVTHAASGCSGWDIASGSAGAADFFGRVSTRCDVRAVIQRVTEARVTVAGEVVGEIGAGALVLLGVGLEDDEATARALGIASSC